MERLLPFSLQRNFGRSLLSYSQHFPGLLDTSLAQVLLLFCKSKKMPAAWATALQACPKPWPKSADLSADPGADRWRDPSCFESIHDGNLPKQDRIPEALWAESVPFGRPKTRSHRLKRVLLYSGRINAFVGWSRFKTIISSKKRGSSQQEYAN